MMNQFYLLFLTACGSSEEKEAESVEDSAIEEEVATEEDRPLPESGCDQEGWLVMNGAEYYYFMNSYNEDDLVVYYELNDLSISLDASVDEAYWYTYTTEGLLETQQDDLEGDGEVDQMAEWVYGPHDYPIEYRMDNEFDGIYDDEWLTTRDDEGYVIEQTLDSAMDGTIDTRWTTEWNEDMTHVILSEDEGDDGTIDRVFEANLDGVNTTYQSRDDGADGELDYIEAWVYNDEGNLTQYELDDDGDGAWDFVRTIEWLSADQVSVIEDVYYDASGAVEATYLSTMSYDSDDLTDQMQVTGSLEYIVDHRWYCAE